MPDHDRADQTTVPDEQRLTSVGLSEIKDSTDLRDMIYRPTLLSLAPAQVPDYLYQPASRRRITIRDQGRSDRCTGHALAALIDVQRLRDGDPLAKAIDAAAVEPVSARMLFEMGERVSSEISGTGQKRYSIRSVIKGFYHNGACLDAHWPERLTSDCAELDMVQCMKEARNLSLGAYFRLEHRLSDYHSAIHEVGAVLVSAEIHRGWLGERIHQAGGLIRPPADDESGTGAHAFVIVGYDQEAFYVLNSWGESWPDAADGRHAPGVARWSYRDWAETVIDAWVLRLAVSTPSAFEYTVGTQGGAYFGSARAGRLDPRQRNELESISVPRQHVIGHYVHFQGRRYVKTGNYPDSRTSLARTLAYLDQRMRRQFGKGMDPGVPRRVYLRVAGDTGTVDSAMHCIARLRRHLRPKGVYPITIVWTAGIASAFAIGIKACMREAVARMPEPSPDRNALIESLIRPVGRALWSELKREAAALSVDPRAYWQRRQDPTVEADGPLVMALKRLNETFDTLPEQSSTPRERRIDLVCEGAGMYVFLKFLKTQRAEAIRLLRHVNHVFIAFPVGNHKALLRQLRRFRRRCRKANVDEQLVDALMTRLIIVRPDARFLQLSSIGPYTDSWFHLVTNSFERQPRPRIDEDDQSSSAGDDSRPIRQAPIPAALPDIGGAEREYYLDGFSTVGIPRGNHKLAGPDPARLVDPVAILRNLVVDPAFVSSLLDPARLVTDGSTNSGGASSVPDRSMTATTNDRPSAGADDATTTETVSGEGAHRKKTDTETLT